MLIKKNYCLFFSLALIAAIVFQLWLLEMQDTRLTGYDEISASVTPKNINGEIPLNQLQAENPEDTIFFSDSYDYIQMYGDPQYWDDEKNMSLDLNGDGIFEEFSISRNHSNGILLQTGMNRNDAWKTMDFWDYNMYDLVRQTSAQEHSQNPIINKTGHFISDDPLILLMHLMEGNSIAKGTGMLDGYYIQLSCCDIDEDGIKEVLVSVGNKLNRNITAIYEYTPNGEIPFTCRGYIRCGTAISYRGNNILWAFREKPAENQYDIYIYK